jgi:glutaconate CoA-transferase subunit B
MRGGGPHRIITDKAVLGFDAQTRTAQVISVHPGISFDEVAANTGFPLRRPDALKETPLPSAEQLRILREEIDPKSVYLGQAI